MNNNTNEFYELRKEFYNTMIKKQGRCNIALYNNDNDYQLLYDFASNLTESLQTYKNMYSKNLKGCIQVEIDLLKEMLEIEKDTYYIALYKDLLSFFEIELKRH